MFSKLDNNFNFLFFFLLKHYKNIFFFMYFNNSFFNFFFKKTFLINFNFKFKNLAIKNNMFFINIFKFINFKQIITYKNKFNNQYLHHFNEFNFNKLFIFNIYLYKFNKFFNLFLFNFFLNGNKLLIFDSFYKNNFLFYSKNFNLYDLVNYDSFFFPKPQFLLRKNWVFYLKYFCDYFNISLIVVNDYYYYKKYFNDIYQLNLPIVSILPYNTAYNLCDFYFFFNNQDFVLVKLFFSLILNNLFFITLNLKQINFFFNYINTFNKFLKT